MSTTIFNIVLLVVFITSMLLTKWLSRILRTKGMIDIPNKRSSHQNPTPRGGGLAILKGLFAGLILFFLLGDVRLTGNLFWIGLGVIALTGFLDDRLNLPVYVRFLFYLLAASLVHFDTGGLSEFPLPEPFNFSLGMLSYPVTVFWIMAVINIYNFLDGIDGFAGVQAIIAGLAIAILDFSGTGYYAGLMIAVASSGFIAYNWHPAKIFMGDIGSASLGYFFAGIPFYFTYVESNIGIYAIGIFLWFFLADGAFTIIRRLLKREKVWEAHRSHLYQQLTVKGLPHHQVVYRVMGAGILLIIVFFIIYFYSYHNLIWILPLALLLFIIYYISVVKIHPEKVKSS